MVIASDNSLERKVHNRYRELAAMKLDLESKRLRLLNHPLLKSSRDAWWLDTGERKQTLDYFDQQISQVDDALSRLNLLLDELGGLLTT